MLEFLHSFLKFVSIHPDRTYFYETKLYFIYINKNLLVNYQSHFFTIKRVHIVLGD